LKLTTYTIFVVLLVLSAATAKAQSSYLEIKNEVAIKQGDPIELAYLTEAPLSPDSWIGLYQKGASTANTSDGRVSYG
jgi:hypothetical protein